MALLGGILSENWRARFEHSLNFRWIDATVFLLVLGTINTLLASCTLNTLLALCSLNTLLALHTLNTSCFTYYKYFLLYVLKMLYFFTLLRPQNALVKCFTINSLVAVDFHRVVIQIGRKRNEMWIFLHICLAEILWQRTELNHVYFVVS